MNEKAFLEAIEAARAFAAYAREKHNLPLVEYRGVLVTYLANFISEDMPAVSAALAEALDIPPVRRAGQ